MCALKNGNGLQILSIFLMIFVISVAYELEKDMPLPSQTIGIDYDPEVSIKGFEEMTLDEVYHILDGLKTGVASGYDRITCKFVKYMREHIGPFMQSSVIRMLFGGIFPDRFKVARVIPIYKEEDEQEDQNNRPISVLPMYIRKYLRLL
jgi:hypothetical protein